ncbi:hypothetical protein ACIRSS_09860 [Amycolatopsis sp. NPDC101161]|uniref:hypothetical protein n=1 Tax=Amycolatopsis sp. NPDC101161 TaxID=3363940 RepID=UPI0037F98949
MFYEIRTEHAHPGRGAEPAGSFTALADEDTFVWIRRFEDRFATALTDRARAVEDQDGRRRESRVVSIGQPVSPIRGIRAFAAGCRPRLS